MLNTHRLQRRTAHCNSRGGFTLVELLVVIGIIAILAGVALGPITSGIKKAQQSAGVQTTRTIALAEFQYSNDNSQTYPSGADASIIARSLLAGNYISDPTIFYIGGSVESKYTGTTAATTIAVTNISYDFVQTTVSSGLNANDPDQLPVIYSSSGTAQTFTATPGAVSIIFTNTNPFGTAGAAVCYHSNSAKFVIAQNASTGTAGSTQICDPSFPGAVAIPALGGG
jgi:prepilin-type N-terminal cleavage/methylation domain-containing protein